MSVAGRSLWTSITEAIPALGWRILELLDRRNYDPRFIDDIIIEIFAFLDPADAARAGRVCSQWNRHADRAAYEHTIIHSASTSAEKLAAVLGRSPRLRGLVRHLTVVHCTLYPHALVAYRRLYGWLEGLPPFSLKSCRFIAHCGPFPLPSILSCPAVATSNCQSFEFGFPRGFRLDLDNTNMLKRCCRATHNDLNDPSEPGFIERLLPSFTMPWDSSRAWLCNITVIVHTHNTERGVIVQLRDMTSLLNAQPVRARNLHLILGYATPPSNLGSWSVLSDVIDCHRRPEAVLSRCLCSLLQKPALETDFRASASATLASVFCKESIQPSTIDTLLGMMHTRSIPPIWGRVIVGVNWANEEVARDSCSECGGAGMAAMSPIDSVLKD